MGRRRHRILGKSPSFMAMNRTRLRAIANGGVTQDFSANISNIRAISTTLGYNILKTPIQRNLLQFSEDFLNSVWQLGNIVLSINANLNPFGVNKSYYATETAVNSQHVFYQNNQITAGSSYTASYYIKKSQDSWIQLILGSIAFGSNAWINFNFDTGNFGIGGSNATWTKTSLSNGYWKISVTETAITSGVNASMTVYGTNNSNASFATAYLGTINHGIVDIAAMQFEQGSIATKYQYTQNLPMDGDYTNANFLYTPSSYGESKNFAQVQNKRNLLQWSEDFTQASWTKTNLTPTVNAITAPNGTLSGNSLLETAVNNTHYIQLQTTYIAIVGQVYTQSVYLKYNGRQWVVLDMYNASDFAGYFDILNGVLGNFTTGVTGTITNDGNGWYRCSITRTITNTVLNSYVAGTLSNGGSLSYNGNTSNGYYIWGAQLEQGAYATPYQKTVASGDGIVDFNFTRATSATVTNKLGVIENSCYNILSNSATGTTQTITVSAGTYTLSLFGTGSYTLSGVSSGVLTGTGSLNRVSAQFVCTSGSLTLTVSGSITNVQLEQGSTPRPYLRTTNRLNVPRLDYSRGLGKPELLIERGSTNLQLQSEAFDVSASWALNSAIIAPNVILSPANITTADKLIESSGLNFHEVARTNIASISANTQYVASVYVKADTKTTMGINCSDGAFGVWTFFNLTTASIISGVGKITNVGNGWFRCEGTRVSGAGTTVGGMSIRLGSNTSNYNGDGVSGLYIWGAQFEQGSTATTYIPTTTASVTRNAETNYVDLWNNSLLNKTNWTLYWEGYLYDGQPTSPSLCLSDTSAASSNTNQIGWYNKVSPFYSIGITKTDIGDSIPNNTFTKLAIQYNNGVATFWSNGLKMSTNKTVPVLDYRYLVLNSGGSTFANDKVTLFNRTLTDTECLNLTNVAGYNLPLLDNYPTDGVAYSFRLLRTLYSGNCIKVRRSSDNALQDIGFSGGLLDTASLLAFVGTSDGFVQTCYDQSPQGVNITQTVNANQPKIVSAGSLIILNGKPSMLFSKATASYFNISTSIFSGAFLDFYYVNKLLSYSSNGYIPLTLSASIFWQSTVADNHMYIQGNNFVNSNTLPLLNNARLINLYCDNSTISTNIDGVNYGVSASAPVTIPSGVLNGFIGHFSSGSGWDYDGYMSEMIIYKSTQITKPLINSNIKNYYGL